MVAAKDYKDYTAGELANELERLQILAAKKIPRFERIKEVAVSDVLGKQGQDIRPT